MSDTTPLTKKEAIRQVIESGTAMDFIDVVNEVKKQYRMEVSAADVEQIFRELASEPRTRVSLAVASSLPSAESQPESKSTQRMPVQSASLPTADGDLEHALHFVKSVGGLSNAKRALDELESVLRQ